MSQATLIIERTEPNFVGRSKDIKYLAGRLAATLGLRKKSVASALRNPMHEFEVTLVTPFDAGSMPDEDLHVFGHDLSPHIACVTIWDGRSLVYHCAVAMREGDLWEDAVSHVVQRWMETQPERAETIRSN